MFSVCKLAQILVQTEYQRCTQIGHICLALCRPCWLVTRGGSPLPLPAASLRNCLVNPVMTRAVLFNLKKNMHFQRITCDYIVQYALQTASGKHLDETWTRFCTLRYRIFKAPMMSACVACIMLLKSCKGPNDTKLSFHDCEERQKWQYLLSNWILISNFSFEFRYSFRFCIVSIQSLSFLHHSRSCQLIIFVFIIIL